MTSTKVKGSSAKPDEVTIEQYKGKFVLIVFQPRDSAFYHGIKAFAEAKDKFLQQNCAILVCTSDHAWSTWSTSPGIKLKGVMAVKSLDDAMASSSGPGKKEIEWGSDAWFDCQYKCSAVVLDGVGVVRHVMSSSVSPAEGVEHCLEVVTCLKSTRMRDAEQLRKVDKESKFAKKGKVKGFQRKSFYELELDNVAGHVKLLGEADLESQFHFPILSRLISH